MGNIHTVYIHWILWIFMWLFDSLFFLRHTKCNQKTEIRYREGGKHFGKRRKCWLLSFPPFPTMFSKGFFSRSLRSLLYGKGLIQIKWRLYVDGWVALSYINMLIISSYWQYRGFNLEPPPWGYEALWKNSGKRRKIWQLAFFPFPTMFSTLSRSVFIISATFEIVICKFDKPRFF